MLQGGSVKLSLTIRLYEAGAMHVLVENPAEKRFHAAPYVISDSTLAPAKNIRMDLDAGKHLCVLQHATLVSDSSFEGYTSAGTAKYVLHLDQFSIECWYNGSLAVVVNKLQTLNYESYRDREKLVEKAKDALDLMVPLTGWKSETLGETVNCPKGPASVALDFAFHELENCYGLPERPRKAMLEPTLNPKPGSWAAGEPYRLFNIDNSEDIKFPRQSLYGNVPLVIAGSPSKKYNAGVLWVNPTDTYADVAKFGTTPEAATSHVHFISECGVLEFVTFLGSSPLDISASCGKLTGTGPMPQYFTLGYHQCRWDHDTQADMESFNERFDKEKIPCDCLWLDIEHTDGKRYFTWDHETFPKPLAMIDKFHQKGRHLVVIVDPHLKTDPAYQPYQEAVSQGILWWF